MKNLRFTLTLLAFVAFAGNTFSQHLHTEHRWEECSIQLDPSLTQTAFKQFTREAGLVTYFRPLVDAKSLSPGHFEISILQWKTGIDSKDAAWNDTFVHPDSTHWLFEGSGLAFPGLTARAGITDKMDVGVYFTKNVNANYGFIGGQVQYNLLNDTEKKWDVAARLNYTQLFGPEDVNHQTYGVDLLASKEFVVAPKWLSVSPYTSVSSYLSHGHEKTTRVNLKDETTLGAQAAVGAIAKIKFARVGLEYNFAKVNTLSFKMGVAF